MEKYSIPLLYSILLHLGLLSLFFLSFANSPRPTAAKPVPEIVQATVLDESRIQAEVEKLKQREEAKRQAERERQQALERKRQAEQQRLAELRRKRHWEQKRLEEEVRRQKAAKEAEARRLTRLLKKQKVEAKRLAELREKQKQLKEKRREEEMRLAALEKKRQQEEQRKRELERKRKEAERLAARKRKQEALRKAEAAAAAKRRAEAERHTQKAVANVISVIQQEVKQNWRKPLGAQSGLSCRIRVRVIPGGEVVDARVVQSSGDPAFDRSAETAVLKASPLPLPSDPAIFARFRTFTFEFKPS